MARRRSVADIQSHEEELIKLARERVKLPDGSLRLDYQSDVDLLAIILDEEMPSTHSDSDLDAGIIYNYAGKKLVSIEVLDLYGTFTT